MRKFLIGAFFFFGVFAVQAQTLNVGPSPQGGMSPYTTTVAPSSGTLPTAATTLARDIVLGVAPSKMHMLWISYVVTTLGSPTATIITFTLPAGVTQSQSAYVCSGWNVTAFALLGAEIVANTVYLSTGALGANSYVVQCLYEAA